MLRTTVFWNIYESRKRENIFLETRDIFSIFLETKTYLQYFMEDNTELYKIITLLLLVYIFIITATAAI